MFSRSRRFGGSPNKIQFFFNEFELILYIIYIGIFRKVCFYIFIFCPGLQIGLDIKMHISIFHQSFEIGWFVRYFRLEEIYSICISFFFGLLDSRMNFLWRLIPEFFLFFFKEIFKETEEIHGPFPRLIGFIGIIKKGF